MRSKGLVGGHHPQIRNKHARCHSKRPFPAPDPNVLDPRTPPSHRPLPHLPFVLSFPVWRHHGNSDLSLPFPSHAWAGGDGWWGWGGWLLIEGRGRVPEGWSLVVIPLPQRPHTRASWPDPAQGKGLGKPRGVLSLQVPGLGSGVQPRLRLGPRPKRSPLSLPPFRLTTALDPGSPTLATTTQEGACRHRE